MIKSLIVIISLVVVVLIIGCGPIESESIEPLEIEISQLEPAKTDPNVTKPVEIIAAPVEPDETEPNISEPVHIEPNEIKPDHIKPVKLEPNNVEAGSIELNDPDEVNSAIEEPNDLELASVEPNNLEPNQVEPDDPKLKPAVSFHDKCADILKSFVDAQGMVNYKMLRRKRLSLKALLDEFDNLDPNVYNFWPKEDKIAFWLNAYNIQMLKIITDNYPIKSTRILRLYPGWGPNSILHIRGIWTSYKFLVMDEEFTLSEIDKRFFRKEFDDPRIFFAISNASLSSPPLRNEPYYGYKLNKQLDDQTQRFLSSPMAFSIDEENQKVYLSSLFQSSSYGKEFLSKFTIDKKFKDHDPTTRAVFNFITNYVSEDAISFLEVGNYSVKFMKYDWTINDGS